jgi:hypothetical protein
LVSAKRPVRDQDLARCEPALTGRHMLFSLGAVALAVAGQALTGLLRTEA